MKQVFQVLKSGEIVIEEVPCPAALPNQVQIESGVSLVSIGTERMLLQFGKANLLEKARQQPDRVRQALEKIKTDGILPTVRTIRSKLSQPIPMGYCNAGFVRSVGRGVTEFTIGDRVLSNGPHAEVVTVPKNLCARIPDDVPFESACFAVPGAIGLHGIRLLQPSLGETVVLIGLGLIGLLSVQILNAHGCHVIGIDLSSERCFMADELGATTIDLSKVPNPLPLVESLTRGCGADAVLITASTDSNEPVQRAAQMCRKRGRIVLVGSAGLELRRSDFYEKELTFQVSCSYGPGRYDPQYEEQGVDYPIGYVRWTEKRNFEAVLDLMASRRLHTSRLISHRFPFTEAKQAYDLVGAGGGLGITLHYEREQPAVTADAASLQSGVVRVAPGPRVSDIVLGVLGAGGFTARTLLPALSSCNIRLRTIASSRLLEATGLAKQFGFEQAASEPETVLQDSSINTVVIATRHNRHADMVIAALQAGKRVFVEKPLCIALDELEAIQATYRQQPEPFLMVGFNRRFAPHIVKMKQVLEQGRGLPKSIVYTVNAGQLPPQHWGHNPSVGGGMILGEGCHFIDLCRFLVGYEITVCDSSFLSSPNGIRDTATIHLAFKDGSIGTVHYFANGHKSLPKERLEVFCAGRALVMDNFRKLAGYGWQGFSKARSFTQNKGHAEEMQAMVTALREGRPSPIPFSEIIEVSRAAIVAGGLSAQDADEAPVEASIEIQ